MKYFGLTLLAVIFVAAAAAPLVAPYEPDRSFRGLLNAPPTLVHPLKLTSQLEQRYEKDLTRRVPVEWFAHGRIVSSSDESAPVLLLGSDGYGRDVFSRLVYGARLSLLVAVASAIGALLLGGLVGGISGYAGGILDDLLMR